MSKRQKIVVATFILLAGIVLSRGGLGTFLQWRFRVPLFTIISFLTTLWALKDEDFGGVEWLTLPILPTMFAISALLVFPLMPSGFDSFLTIPVTVDTSIILSTSVKLIFLSFFVVGYYACILTANIFNIAAIRNIQLLRVAHSVGFLATVACALIFYIVLFSLHLSGFWNFLLVSFVSAPLIFQAIWSTKLETAIGQRVIYFTLATALVLGEIAWILSFWPVTISIMALFLTAMFYEMVGIIQYYFDERLNDKVTKEFIFVAVAIFFITITAARWGN